MRRAVAGLMADLPLKKLRNFGGKLGAELAELGCGTAGQVAALPAGALEKRFGPQRAGLIAAAMRGCSDEPVTVRAPARRGLCMRGGPRIVYNLCKCA